MKRNQAKEAVEEAIKIVGRKLEKSLNTSYETNNRKFWNTVNVLKGNMNKNIKDIEEKALVSGITFKKKLQENSK